MIKAGKWTYTEEKLEQMFAEADRRGQKVLKTEIQAHSKQPASLGNANGIRFSLQAQQHQDLAPAFG